MSNRNQGKFRLCTYSNIPPSKLRVKLSQSHIDQIRHEREAFDRITTYNINNTQAISCYLYNVRHFSGKVGTDKELFAKISDFAQSKCRASDLIIHAARLFDTHDSLLDGLLAVLPAGYQITVFGENKVKTIKVVAVSGERFVIYRVPLQDIKSLSRQHPPQPQPRAQQPLPTSSPPTTTEPLPTPKSLGVSTSKSITESPNKSPNETIISYYSHDLAPTPIPTASYQQIHAQHSNNVSPSTPVDSESFTHNIANTASKNSSNSPNQDNHVNVQVQPSLASNSTNLDSQHQKGTRPTQSLFALPAPSSLLRHHDDQQCGNTRSPYILPPPPFMPAPSAFVPTENQVPNYVNTSTAVTSSRPTEIIPQYNQISAASPSSPSPSQVQSASVHNQQQTNLVYLQNGNIPISNDFTTNTLPPITTIPPPPPPPNNNNNNSNALANTFTGPNLPLSRRHINPSPQVFNPETRTYESFNPETGTYESFNHIPTLVFDSQHSRHERPQSIPLQQPLPNSFHNSVSTYYQQPYLPVSQQLSTLQQQQQLQLQRLQPPTHSTSASAPVNNSNDTNLLSKTTTLQVNNVSAAATKSTTDVRINNEPLSENNARKSPKGTLTLSKSIDCEAVPNKSDRPATQDDDVATPTIKGSGDSNAIDNTKSPKKLLITTNEMSIIDDLRKYLQPSGFQYFLKLMDMVNNDIIDRDALVDFITPAFNDDSDKEHGLLQRLKTLVGYGGGSAKYQLKTIASTIPKPDLSELLSIEESPSYRKVTNLEWVNQPCSARDDLCREVLNDVYISYPTEESEGSNADTFTLNRYEEQLHRCEEKRYEFDSVIDDNEKAIILLQMILEDLEKLEAKDDSDSDSDSDSDEDSEDNDNDDDGDDEERDNEEKFDSLVNQLNKFIIIKAIKVAYGKRHAPRVIEGLLKHPIQNIPAILEFLESEGEKWELARTELNDIWREIEKENHVLSLKRKRNEISGRK